jgi:thioredoxin-like negative regulator of GroEL
VPAQQLASTTQRPLATATAKTRPSLLFIYSPTSGPSRRAEGYLAQVLQRRANHDTFRLSRINASKRPDLVERLRVSELPALLVVADRRIQARLVRPRGCAEITRFLSPWLK